MIKRGRRHLSRRRSWIDDAQESLRNRNERTKKDNTKGTKIKQKQNKEKQTKEREMGKGRDEKQARSIRALALLRELFRAPFGQVVERKRGMKFY
jgi:hypothetical protein